MTIASLYNIGPGALCNECGHFAGRHIGMQCLWPESRCKCEGMLWQGERVEMNGMNGPAVSSDG